MFLIILAVLFILFAVLVIMFFYLDKNSNRFNLYAKNEWPRFFIDLFIAIFGATIAVSCILGGYRLEMKGSIEVERKTYSRYFAMIMWETSSNLAKLIRLKEINEKAFVFWELSEKQINNTISNPLTYKYVGKEYVYLLSIYLTELDVLRNQIALFRDIHLGGIHDKGFDLTPSSVPL